MSEFSSFLRLNNIPLYIHHVLLTHPCVGGHLGCFYALAIMNNAPVNMNDFFFFNSALNYLGYILRSGIAGSFCNSIITF